MQKLFIFSLVAILCGCDLKGKKIAPDAGQSSGANFQVTSVKGEMSTADIHPVFQTPEVRLFNFRACLVDNAFNKKMAHQKFIVSSPEQRLSEVRTHDDGCLSWQEKMKINFFSNSVHLRVLRRLTGVGAGRGTVEIPLAINPWMFSEKLPEVIDLRRDSVAHLDTNQGSALTSRRAPMWIEKFEIQDIKEYAVTAGQMTFSARLALKPQFMVKNSLGQEELVPIPGGEYRIQLILFSEQVDGQQREILDSLDIENVKAVKGQITHDVHIKPKKFPAKGIYKIGLRIAPQNSPPGLAHFEGVFDLASVSAAVWTGSKTAQLTSEVYVQRGKFSLKYLEEQGALIKVAPLNTGYYVAEDLKCSFNGIASENSTRRSIGYKLHICIKRRDGQNLRSSAEVRVYRHKDNRTESVAHWTNDQGCIEFDDAITHRYFEKERRFLAQFHVQSTELGLNETVPLQINPWDYGWTFCRDARFLDPKLKKDLEDSERVAESKAASEYFIDQVDVSEQQVQYQIDRFLHLTVLKTIRFGIYPKVRRPSSQTAGENQVEPLRTGLYLLRFAIIRNHYEVPEMAHEYIEGGETIAQVVGGRLVKDVDIRMRDLRLIDSRNRLLLELNTIDEGKVIKVGPNEYAPKPGLTYRDVVDHTSGLRPTIFDGPLEFNGNDRITLFPFELNRITKSMVKQLETYKSWGLHLPEPIKLDGLSLAFNDLGEWIAAAENLRTLENRKQEQIANSFEQTQNLVSWTEQQQIVPGLKREALLRAIDEHVVSESDYRQLCQYWAQNWIPDLAQTKFGVKLSKSNKSDMFVQCIVNRKPLLSRFQYMQSLGVIHEPFLIFQSIYQVEDARFKDFVPPGRSFELSISESFSVETKFKHEAGMKLSPPLPGQGFVPSLSIDVGVGFGRGNSMEFSSGMEFQVEENSFAVELSKYRRCLLVGVHPLAFGLAPIMLPARLHQRQISEQAWREALLSHKLLVCEDQRREPVAKLERYYYVQSASPHGYQQDRTDLRNRWYSFSLRSERDMLAFIRKGRGELRYPQRNDSTYEGFGHWKNVLDTSFSSVLPAAPGIYVDAVF